MIRPLDHNNFKSHFNVRVVDSSIGLDASIESS